MTATSFGDIADRLTSTSFIMEVGYVPTTLVTTSDSATTVTSSGGSSASSAPSVSTFAVVAVVDALTEVITDPLQFRSDITIPKTEPLILDLNLNVGAKPIKRIAVYINEKPEPGYPAKGGSYIIYDKFNQFATNICLQGDNPLHLLEDTVYYCNKAALFDSVNVDVNQSLNNFNAKFTIYFTETFEEYDIAIYAHDENNYGISQASLPKLYLTVVEPEEFVELEEPVIETKEIFVQPEREEIPDWIKVRSKTWATDDSSDVAFAQGILYMMNKEILSIPEDRAIVIDTNSEEDLKMPSWVKNNAQWWSDDIISEDEFVNALQFMLNNNHITFD